MTKVMINGLVWLCVVIVLEWHTKKVVGYYAGLQAKARHWLNALNKAVDRQFAHCVRGYGQKLMADNGCQPTSLAFMKPCRVLGITQAFTNDNNL